MNSSALCQKEGETSVPSRKSYTVVQVTRDEDLFEQIGRDIYFDLVDHDNIGKFYVLQQMPFNLFKEEVAKQFGVPVRLQRFWQWAKRQNHTYRPYRPLTPEAESLSVGQLKTDNGKLKLFLEVEHGLDLHPIPPPHRTKEDIMLFFKLYDPEKEELRYVGRLFVKSSGNPLDILRKLNEMASFAPDEEIELYEEIKFEPSVMCEQVDKKFTFHASQLEDGDIICLQKPLVGESLTQCRYPDVPSFLEYVHNCQIKKDNQPIKDSQSSRFTWRIENFSRLNAKQHYSDVFFVGCHKWQLLIFPKGNNVDYLSIYLYAVDFANLPFAFVSFTVVNQIHNQYTVIKDTLHQFTAGESDWGFTSFMPLSQLNDPQKGYIKSDTCIVEAEIDVCRVMDNSTYYSKKAVYHRPIPKNCRPSGGIGLQSGALSGGKSTKAQPHVEMPVEVMGSLSEPASQTGLDVERNEPLEVLEAFVEVQLAEQLPEPATQPMPGDVSLPSSTTQSGESELIHEYPSAGQLFERGRNHPGTFDEKFQDVGGFSILKTQASLYEQIWLKYGHIASSQVLTSSYIGQVAMVAEIMKSVMEMHRCRHTELSSAMIDMWEDKIKMAEKLEFNAKWLRERFEDVKRDFYGEQKLKTLLVEHDRSLLQAKLQLLTAEEQLKMAQESVSALETSRGPLVSERQMYLEKSSRLLFDGLF